MLLYLESGVVNIELLTDVKHLDIPGSPVVKTVLALKGGTGSISEWGIMIPDVMAWQK